MVGSKVAHFRILAPLGEGGMARVWRAWDELQQRPVALKILSTTLARSEDARRRFRREAKTVAALQHRAIAPVYEWGEAGDQMYIAMALVDGETVTALVGQRLLPLSQAVHIATETAHGLAHAHGQGVVHRDVTSRNVIVSREGSVYLLDFGLALVRGATRFTSKHTLLGTMAYMAPETLLSHQADERSDLYSLGVVFYEALTGKLPFQGDRDEVVTFEALSRSVSAPSASRAEISPELDRIVLRLVAREPERRYQTAGEFIAEITRLIATTPAGGGSPAPADSMASRIGSGRGPIYLAVLPIRSPDPMSGAGGATARMLDDLVTAVMSSVARAGRVHVVPVSEEAARTAARDLQAFAREVGCNLVLKSSAQIAGTALRITYGLVDPEQGQQIAGGNVDGSTVLPFELQDRLAASVRAALGTREPLLPEDRPARPPDPAAAERLEQALGYMQRYDNEASLDGAIALLQGLLRTEGERPQILAALARAYLHKHQLTRQRTWEGQAAAACARAVELAPDAPEVQLALGELHVAGGRWEDALAAHDRALAADPKLYEALLGRARALEGLKRPDEAEAACDCAIELRPADWRGYHTRGLMLFLNGRYNEALVPWRRVTELTPDNASAHSNLGATYFNIDEFQNAETVIRRSLAIRPSAMGYYNLGTLLFFLEKFDDCVTAFEKAVDLNPADPVAWGNLGNACRLILGREARAAEALDSAIGLMRERLERSPNSGDAWARLAGYLAGRGRRDEAEDAVHRALELSPQNPYCLWAAGHTYFLLGRRDDALRCLAEAVHRGYGVDALRHDPDLKPLGTDPEFLKILEEGSNHQRDAHAP